MYKKIINSIKSIKAIKLDKRKVTFLLAVIMLLNTLSGGLVYADAMEVVTNVLDSSISFFIRLFGNVLYDLFFESGAVNSIENVVYNNGGTDLALLGSSNNALTKFIVQFYDLMNYIAVVFFVPIGLWFTVVLVRAGEDAQKKAEMKEKGFRLFVTYMWLVSMPQLLEWLFIFANALTSMFYSIINEVVGGSDLMKDGLILTYMKELAEETKTSVHAATYLITIFVNLWMIFYYFIRDITISFLFIIFPILAVLYPLKKGAVMTWWKEMASNVLTQTIHAFLMTTVVALAHYLSPSATGNATMSFTDSMYVLTAFAMVIPFTSILKSMLGIEGSVGGAKSLAGLGAMYGAMRLGSMGIQGLKQGVGKFRDGLSEGIGAASDYMTLKKKGDTDPLTGELTATNRFGETITRDSVNERIKTAGTNSVKGFGSTFGGLTMGLGTAAGSLAFGSPTSAIMAGMGASYVGSKLGDTAGGIVTGAIDKTKGTVDLVKLANSHQSVQDKEFGLTSPVLQNTDYKDSEAKGRWAERIFSTYGMNNLAGLSYAALSSKEVTTSELQNVKEAEMYVDKNQSVLYGYDNEGNKKILRTGQGDPSVKIPYTRKATFNNEELELPESRRNALMTKAEELTNNELEPIITSKAEDILTLRGLNKESEEGDRLFEHITSGALFDSNSEFYDKNISKQYHHIKADNYNKLEKAELNETKLMRNNLGVNGLSLTSESKIATGSHSLFDTEREIVSMASKSVTADGLVKVQDWSSGLDSNEVETIDGVGYSLTSEQGTTYFRVDSNGNRKAIGYGAGNPKLRGNQLEMAPIKVENGGIYQDQIKYALEGVGFNTVEPTRAEIFNDADIRLGQDIISQIQPNSQIMITVEKGTDSGSYGVYDISRGQYIGSSPIPEDYILGGNEINGQVYHIQVDTLGSMLQQNAHSMTDVDFHNALSIQNSRGSEIKNRELKIRETQLSQLAEEKNKLKNVLSNLYNDEQVHSNYISSIQ